VGLSTRHLFDDHGKRGFFSVHGAGVKGVQYPARLLADAPLDGLLAAHPLMRGTVA